MFFPLQQVQSIFHDSSAGNAIDITVVRVEVIKNRNFVHLSATRSLQNFCRWQYLNNPTSDENGDHYDLAILLTRENLCRNTNVYCDTLGLAHLARVCDPQLSCALIQENGLSTSFTIAHEVAHVIGLTHDRSGSGGGTSTTADGEAMSIMSPTLSSRHNPWIFSKFSRDELIKLMDSPATDCLLDEPQVDWIKGAQIYYFGADEVSSLPGERFTADTQCELIFGPGSKVCPFMPVCKRLWCVVKGVAGCRTHHMPWADGTECAPDHWCYRARCVIKKPLKPVNGGWSKWSPFSTCSRACGGGVSQATRECTSPEPRNGGQYCLGERVKYKSCNVQECPHTRFAGRRMGNYLYHDPRSDMCSRYNGQTLGFLNTSAPVQWVPYYHPVSQCKLYCTPVNSSEHYLLSDRVTDGVPCSLKSDDICVNGKCVSAGCDHVLGSQLKRDKCGICGGDGSTCMVINKSLTLTHLRWGYNYLLTIPVHSFNIKIKRFGGGENCLSLRTDRGKYLLNGKYKILRYPKVYQFNNITLNYTGCDSKLHSETIHIVSSVPQRLHIELLTKMPTHLPHIDFSYIEFLPIN